MTAGQIWFIVLLFTSGSILTIFAGLFFAYMPHEPRPARTIVVCLVAGSIQAAFALMWYMVHGNALFNC